MIKLVMNDAYIQYKALKSQNQFLYDDNKEKITFADSFSKSKYQGVVELSKFNFYRYIVDKGIISWEEKFTSLNTDFSDDSRKNIKSISSLNKYGSIDIMKFYQKHIPLLNTNEKCPWCVVGVIGIIVGAVNCSMNTELCNQRCSNCIYGAQKCESSCFTNSCTVICNSGPAQQIIYDPWGSDDNFLLLVPISDV